MHLVKQAAAKAIGLPIGLTKGLVHVVSGSAGRGHSEEPTPSAPRREPTPEPGAEPSGPNLVLAEPHAPEEPPVDVVGAALAAEEVGGATGAAFAHEPRAASRDEEHGDAALQRATVDDIVEETAAALEGDVDPEPHLTQPLFDASDTKSAMAEMATMRKAADPDKG